MAEGDRSHTSSAFPKALELFRGYRGISTGGVEHHISEPAAFCAPTVCNKGQLCHQHCAGASEGHSPVGDQNPTPWDPGMPPPHIPVAWSCLTVAVWERGAARGAPLPNPNGRTSLSAVGPHRVPIAALPAR